MFKGIVFSPRAVTVCAALWASVTPFAVQAQEASANALALEFAPPLIEPVQICEAREPDIDTTAKWEEWDGLRLPNVDHALIKRDMNRLIQINPGYWSATIQLIIDRLEEVDPSYAGENADLARIKALVAAGAYDELSDRQLVTQLADATTNQSARVKNALAEFYRDGIGVPRDIERANTLLVEAGFAGNADALLALTKMDLDGEGVEGWDLDPSLAVTMAFGSLVGELDASICDRVSRIAREYNNGEIVQHSTQLAHDWFRFAADLGDSNAAWKVVEYHLLAENFAKDNDLLLQYLTQASDDGLPYAQVALGEIYETGSLVEQDLDETLALYRAAATSGQRAGLIRLTQFLEKYPERFGDVDSERVNALRALAEFDGAPGWVFTRLAKGIYETEGRWAGQDEAIAYLERAADLGDMDAMIDLAEALVSRRSNTDDFERAVDLLSYSVSTLGGVSPSSSLYGMFMCQAIDSPRIAEANHWIATENATDTADLALTADEVLQLDADEDVLTVASLQSHALYGRPRALANYLKFLESSPDGDPVLLAFWQDYADRYASVLEAMAELELELDADPRQRLVAIDLLRRQYKRLGSDAALTLAEAMLDYEASDAVFKADEVRALLEQPASAGEGAAMRLLASLAGGESANQQIYEQYADVIDANGDFDALLFAAPFVDKETQDNYLSRAAGIIQCDYKATMSMAQVYLDIGDQENAIHWVGVAEHLLEDSTWTRIDLAEVKLELHGTEAAEDALELFQAAFDLGDPDASRGIVDLSLDQEAATYDPTRAAEMISHALEQDDQVNLGRFLSRYRSADTSAQEAIDGLLDMPAVYEVSARSGDIYSMRVYAMHLRDNAANADDLIQSTEWLARAAEGGDTAAMAEYGYSLAFGIGAEADLPTALDWLQQAAENGSTKAAAITALLNIDGDT